MKYIFTLLFAMAMVSNSYTQIRIEKTLDDDNSKYTNVGNIGITITNFGTYGHGFAKWPYQPSCEYPKGSGIEHIFDGGLYIGGFRSDDSLGRNRIGPFVTTGAVDAASVAARGGGFEFTNAKGSLVRERSSLLDSKFYDPRAISHQDLIAEYTDSNTTFSNGEPITDHTPLGVVVRQESYAWDFPFVDFLVIMNYTIKNESNKYLDSVYVGMWTDAVIRNTKVSPPGTSNFFTKGGNGFIDTLKLAYEFDAGGDTAFTKSYLGIQYLGSSTPFDSANFVSWQFRNTSDPLFFAPQVDDDRYTKLQGFFGGNFRFNYGVNPDQLKSPSNRSFLISVGPFTQIKPHDSINVVFAFVAAKMFGGGSPAEDSELQKKTFYSNADWALRTYFGEDRNRNGVLDPGEDNDGDGKITRYVLPSPPLNPKVRTEIKSNSVTLYWDKRSESSIDPISGEKDFEGYRLYRTNTGFDLTGAQNPSEDLVKLAEFDSAGNGLFFETGFNAVALSAPVKFPGDSTEYHYSYTIDNLLNGWQYLFSVTSFDKGDKVNKIESLESSPLTNLQRILPGTPPTSDENTEVGVYPNPYYGNAYWDGSSERLRKIYFYNLPKECEITVYTLSGDIVKKMEHNSTSSGTNNKWFETYAGDNRQQFSGGEHAWDLITDGDQAVATGLYLFTVKDLSNGNIKRGKFLIIK